MTFSPGERGKMKDAARKKLEIIYGAVQGVSFSSWRAYSGINGFASLADGWKSSSSLDDFDKTRLAIVVYAYCVVRRQIKRYADERCDTSCLSPAAPATPEELKNRCTIDPFVPKKDKDEKSIMGRARATLGDVRAALGGVPATLGAGLGASTVKEQVVAQDSAPNTGHGQPTTATNSLATSGTAVQAPSGVKLSSASTGKIDLVDAVKREWPDFAVAIMGPRPVPLLLKSPLSRTECAPPDTARTLARYLLHGSDRQAAGDAGADEQWRVPASSVQKTANELMFRIHDKISDEGAIVNLLQSNPAPGRREDYNRRTGLLLHVWCETEGLSISTFQKLAGSSRLVRSVAVAELFDYPENLRRYFKRTSCAIRIGANMGNGHLEVDAQAARNYAARLAELYKKVQKKRKELRANGFVPQATPLGVEEKAMRTFNAFEEFLEEMVDLVQRQQPEQEKVGIKNSAANAWKKVTGDPKRENDIVCDDCVNASGVFVNEAECGMKTDVGEPVAPDLAALLPARITLTSSQGQSATSTGFPSVLFCPAPQSTRKQINSRVLRLASAEKVTGPKPWSQIAGLMKPPCLRLAFASANAGTAAAHEDNDCEEMLRIVKKQGMVAPGADPQVALTTVSSGKASTAAQAARSEGSDGQPINLDEGLAYCWSRWLRHLPRFSAPENDRCRRNTSTVCILLRKRHR
ncbi:unnamed protein product [Amoebophrya sp. A120]|nr:unnamed protein product [Amoebophrya sp. A120]|eukprot:GSA120T00022975001.1